MICKVCAKKIMGNAKFCPYCGARQEKDSSATAAPSDKRKRKKGFLFILATITILSLLTGTASGYYVAKNGWEVVPFAETFSFLPIVKFDKEVIETYSKPIDQEADEALEKKSTPIDNEKDR